MGCASSGGAASTPVAQLSEQRHEDFHSRYWLGDKIGKGSYAQVHLARSRLNSGAGLVAVKIRKLHSTHCSSSLYKKICFSAYREVCFWSRVAEHRNCVNMHENFFDDYFCYMVMERCKYGLVSYLKILPTITESTLVPVFHQMLQGLAHVHSFNIVHRDVKPENFLVGGRDGQTVKLADFGLAAIVPESGKVAKVCGTAAYMCPEMILLREADFKADIWSLGVTAYLLLCGHFPYVGKDDSSKSMQRAIVEGLPPSCEKPWLTLAAISFSAALLDRDPITRPSATSALSLPLLRSAYQAQTDLRPMLLAAEKEGSFASPDLSKSSAHDELLIRLNDEDIERSGGKVLTQSHIDAFIKTSPEKTDQLMEAFLFPTHSDSKAQEDCVSDVSTTDNGSPKPSSASSPTPGSFDVSYRAVVMLTNSMVSVRSS